MKYIYGKVYAAQMNHDIPIIYSLLQLDLPPWRTDSSTANSPD